MAAREHPRYANTEWKDYEFREYPKMVYPGAKDPTKPYDKKNRPLRGIQVHNEQEEREALSLGEKDETVSDAPRKGDTVLRGGKTVPTATKGVERLRTADDDKTELITEAETLGVKIDKSWSVARIQDAIDTHKSEVV